MYCESVQFSPKSLKYCTKFNLGTQLSDIMSAVNTRDDGWFPL